MGRGVAKSHDLILSHHDFIYIGVVTSPHIKEGLSSLYRGSHMTSFKTTDPRPFFHTCEGIEYSLNDAVIIHQLLVGLLQLKCSVISFISPLL